MMEFLEQKGLLNVVRHPTGIHCGCPLCISQGSDSMRNHLSILNDGRFHCAKDGSKEHNRSLYNLLYRGEDLEIIFTPVEPKTKVTKVYDESMLLRLIPDYSYWQNRGISEPTLKLFGGGIAPKTDGGKLRGRYCLPIRDELGRLIGFSGRLVTDSEFAPKYKHLMPSSLALWPLHLSRAAIAEAGSVVLIEGPADCLALFERGIKNTLVLFGLNLSSKMLAALVRLNPPRIIISTNNDVRNAKGHRPGQEAAAAIRTALLSFFDEERVLVHLPVSNDWCAAHEAAQDAEFQSLREAMV